MKSKLHRVAPVTKLKGPDRIVFNPTGATIVDPVTGRLRTGCFAHYCYSQNELLIDETDIEFQTCDCGNSE
ncbi:MAG: hypothetical protein ACRD32_02235 [Nitrososphaerales archaeon]